MKVLLTGGTGFIGCEVAEVLSDRGYKVRLLLRNPRSRAAEEVVRKTGGEPCVGDVCDSASLAGACRDMDAVIHLVGIISERRKGDFEKVHTIGTRNIVEAARDAGVSRFAHMSALGARPDAASRYHRSKWAAEEWVRGSGLDAVVFRPSVVYGRDDKFINLFARMLRYSPVLPVFGSGDNKVQPVAVEDVAHCFVGAVDSADVAGRVFDLCGEEEFTFNALLETIMRAAGKRRMKVHVPFAAAFVLAYLMGIVYRGVLRMPPPLNREQLLMLREDNTGDPIPAMRMFRFEPKRMAPAIEAYLR